jgi:hypothetical protein
MNHLKIEERHDCEVVYVHGAVVSRLAGFLNVSLPWVWILGHRPNRYFQWQESTVPLNSGGRIERALVRDMCFDLQMPTADFISSASDFDDHGLVLIQSDRVMPDTLALDRVPESQQNQVLMQNGAALRIFLPHAIETAQVVSYKKGYLSTIIDSPS